MTFVHLHSNLMNVFVLPGDTQDTASADDMRSTTRQTSTQPICEIGEAVSYCVSFFANESAVSD